MLLPCALTISYHCIRLNVAFDYIEEELSSSEESDDDSDSSESSPDGQEGATGYQLSPTGGRKLTPEKIQSAAARQHKREEMKRLRIAQEIQRQLQEVIVL